MKWSVWEEICNVEKGLKGIEVASGWAEVKVSWYVVMLDLNYKE